MKKFLALTCVIACLFGMTACGGDKQLSEYEQEKLDAAVMKVENQLIPDIQLLLTDPYYDGLYADLNEFTPQEVEWAVATLFGLEADGRAFVSAVDSFASTSEEIGGLDGIAIIGSEAVIDGDQIIVNVSIKGSRQDAVAEVVLSNDRFLALEAASLNKVNTMGDAMAKAGLNTLLGMGTVFAVLILISLIISCFGVIPKIQAGLARTKEDKTVQTTGINNAVAQISEQEKSNELSDDLELVAVIAAAIAASEGAVSTDGFVVRSIKRRRAY